MDSNTTTQAVVNVYKQEFSAMCYNVDMLESSEFENVYSYPFGHTDFESSFIEFDYYFYEISCHAFSKYILILD